MNFEIFLFCVFSLQIIDSRGFSGSSRAIIRESSAKKEQCKNVHPWLAGAQYRTTAVVSLYRLISLIGPHCPESTYSSTYPFSAAHFVVATKKKIKIKKEKESSKPVKEEKKKISMRVYLFIEHLRLLKYIYIYIENERSID